MSTASITGVHPYADKFPMLPESELSELAESILQNGLRQPIVLTEDGLILDGRNRAKACEMAGVTPTTVVYDGDDLAEYVIDSNSSRRHMSTGARAMSTALVLLDAVGREGGKWKYGAVAKAKRSESGTSVNQWSQRLAECGFILDNSPELADLIVSGEVALDSAYRQAEQSRDAERRKLEEQERLKAEEADAEAFVKENAPDLAGRVDGKDLHSYVEARDIWSRRNREEAAELRRRQEQERKAKEAEEQTYRKQVADASQALSMVAILAIPEQQQFTLEAITRFPDVMSREQSQLHTPEHLRRLASGLNNYADLLEAHNA